MVYLRPNQNTNLSLPNVNYKRLRRLANLLIDPATLEDWEEIPPLTDLSTDYDVRAQMPGILITPGIAMVAILFTLAR